MRLDLFESSGFDRGAPRVKELFWVVCGGVLLSSWIAGAAWRVRILTLFGASIGRGVVIKPGVHVKFPWRLTIGNHCWVGENVWIDNLAQVSLGDHACVSQGAYFCTGSHDWSKVTFDLIVKPIEVGSHAWVGAMSRVAPGVVIGDGAVLSLGSVATSSLEPWTINAGHPAVRIKARPRAA